MSDLESELQGSDGEMTTTATAPIVVRPRGSEEDMTRSERTPAPDRDTQVRELLGTASLLELTTAAVRRAQELGMDTTTIGHLAIGMEAAAAAEASQRRAA